MQDDTVQMQQKNTVPYYRKSREAHGKWDPAIKPLDHTDRPAEECQEPQGMLEGKPGLFNTKHKASEEHGEKA